MANFCSNCGNAVNSEMNFCPNCGKRITQESRTENSSSSSSSHMMLLTGLAALAGGAMLSTAGHAFAQIANAGTNDIYNFFGINPLALENFTGTEGVTDIDGEILENVEVNGVSDVENVAENISDVADTTDIIDSVSDVVDGVDFFDDMDIF